MASAARRRTLVLGGVRSGKSAFGESLLADHDRVRYIATGPTTSTDAEWMARIATHRERRDSRYATVETADAAAALRDDPRSPTLVDDLGTWLAGQIDRAGGWTDTSVDMSESVDELCSAIADFDDDLVLISPEVGLAPVPPTPAGRRFQDELGILNAAVAAVCDRVVLIVAGRVLELSDADVVAVPDTSRAPVPTTAAQTPSVTRSSTPPDVAPAATPVPIPSGDNTFPVDGTDAEIFPPISPPDYATRERARRRQLTLTKPPGSLGRLEDVAAWVAACQNTCPPRPFGQPTVAVFAGDHGVAQGGVSAFPPEVTAQMVANIASGGAAVNVLGRRTGADVRVYDLSVDADTAPEVSRYKVRRSCGDLRETDTLTMAEARAALAAGRAIADELVDGGADLLIAGEMGIGNTTPATVLIGTLTHREPVEIIGRGTGIDDAGWIRKAAAIRDGMRRGRRYVHDPLSLLAAVAGADLTAMAGFLAQAAVRATPVILDGVVVTAAAMVANDLAPGSVSWWIAGHRSAEPAHSIALEHLDLVPLLELSMRLGEGSGALTALPLVSSAVDLLASMATFDEAGVSEKATSDPADAPAPMG